MVSSSKILTVSYGTFSCTAEGFDDPLAVIKEATQFYRGVVREEPWFGAEPQQLDTELVNDMMRAQMVARHQNGSVTLSAPQTASAASAGALAASLTAGPARNTSLPDDALIEETARAAGLMNDTPPSGPTEARLDETGGTASAEADTVTKDQAASEHDTENDDIADLAKMDLGSDPSQTPITPAPVSTMRESVTAKLERIRNVVAESTVELASGPFEDDDLESSNSNTLEVLAELANNEDEKSGNSIADTIAGLVQEETLVQEVEEKQSPTGSETELEDTVADLIEENADEAFGATAPAETANDDLDLGDSEQTDWAEEDENEDEPVSARSNLTESDWDELSHEKPLTDDPTDDFEVAAENTDDTPEALIDEPGESVEAPEDGAPQRQKLRVLKVKRLTFEQAIQDGMIETVDRNQLNAPVSAGVGIALSPQEEADLARELAMVKAELDNEFGYEKDDVTNDPVDEFDGMDDLEMSDDTQPMASHPGQSAPKQPAELPLRLDNPVSTPDRSQNAGVFAGGADVIPTANNAETRDTFADVQELDTDSKATKQARAARAMLTETNVEETDASRLLDQTNQELDKPDGTRRRSAIAHLRAAVAATRADTVLKPKTHDPKVEEPYREDLASVVRPRRPQTGGETRTQRPAVAPARQTAPPLTLVAEQRVDRVDADVVAPVRPRRVAMDSTQRPTTDNDPSSDPLQPDTGADFAAYAEQVGATNLPQMLEAAAAFLSFVEGHEQFSRPQLMNKLRQAESEQSSREERLRGFGELLRSGKIERTTGGRFTASEGINFKPDRMAG